MFKFDHLKETIAVFILNAISDHEMSFEIRHTIKHNFRLKLENSLTYWPSTQFTRMLIKKSVCSIQLFSSSKCAIFCDDWIFMISDWMALWFVKAWKKVPWAARKEGIHLRKKADKIVTVHGLFNCWKKKSECKKTDNLYSFAQKLLEFIRTLIQGDRKCETRWKNWDEKEKEFCDVLGLDNM